MPVSSAPLRVVQFGIFEVDLRSGELRKAGTRVKLHDQPFQVLVMLLEHPGELVTRDEIRQKLWPGDTFVDFDHGLNSAINRLRDALGDSADTPRFIETLPRRGYRFIGTVSASARSEGVPATETVPATRTEPNSARVGRNTRYGWIALALASVLVAALAGLRFRVVHARLLPRTLHTVPIRALAVLPLQNLSGDDSQEYLADGMTDALTTNLANISSLRVISVTSAMHYKGSHQALPEIARELNVDAVVEGSVVRVGDRVRIDAQLIQAVPERHLWANAYERDLGDVLMLQSEVTWAIAAQVQAKVSPRERTLLASARPVNPQAYEAYLKGEYFLNKWSTDGFEKAKNYLQKSINLDPTYAPGYAGMGNYYSLVAFRRMAPPRSAYLKAEVFSRKALELDETATEAYTILAMIKLLFRCDPSGAEKDLNRVRELYPGDMGALEAHSYYLVEIGRMDEAIVEKKRALEDDPLSVSANAEFGLYLWRAGRNDEAIQQFQKTLELDPNYAPAHSRLGMAYASKQQYSQAVAELKKGIALDKTPERMWVLTDVYDNWGKRREARATLHELVRMSAHRYTPPQIIAGFYARFGDKAAALAWLGRASEDDMPDLSASGFDSLRSDPRFRNLEKRFQAAGVCQ
jgi:TolB-like protein/DNA-binding winged helix-turn-helix (wHTH) protein/Tfp pilus assembly protein PilF